MHYLSQDTHIAVIGLGYVGLPLAVEFGKKYPTMGFDINKQRVAELQAGQDYTLEVSLAELKSANKLMYTASVDELSEANIYIVTVPTPINENKQPDLNPLINASKSIGRVLRKGDIVIYESTVYPGATEEDCVPVLEKISGLTFNVDFYVGYSPERINPGDKGKRVSNILKVTSGSTPQTAEIVDQLYKSIITAGTHKATSIKIAEASKVIENVQRDVNIALVNELHQIFERLGINTKEVIEAASTKWNFMKLQPGLVGGHCIGVDPYYLLHKSQASGYIPDLMRKAREINDYMPVYIAQDFLKKLIKEKINPVGCRVALLGFTFKENCPDIRNTKVYDLYLSLVDLGFTVDVVDPWADSEEVRKEYGLSVKRECDFFNVDVFLLAVGHDKLVDALKTKVKNKFIYDFKGLLS